MSSSAGSEITNNRRANSNWKCVQVSNVWQQLVWKVCACRKWIYLRQKVAANANTNANGKTSKPPGNGIFSIGNQFPRTEENYSASLNWYLIQEYKELFTHYFSLCTPCISVKKTLEQERNFSFKIRDSKIPGHLRTSQYLLRSFQQVHHTHLFYE